MNRFNDVQDIVEVVEDISSEARDISEEFAEIQQQRAEFQTAIDDWNGDKQEEINE